MKNIFIVLDGLDGAGKSEIIKGLHNYLFSQKKYSILTTAEPTQGRFGTKIRRILATEKNPAEGKERLLELFIKDREEHLTTTILPFLNSESAEVHIVLCDRYYYSTLAFQHTQGISMDELIKKNSSFQKPDIAFILDIEPSLALARIAHRPKEKFEDNTFMLALRKNFLALQGALTDNIKVIRAERSYSDVLKEVIEETDKTLDKLTTSKSP